MQIGIAIGAGVGDRHRDEAMLERIERTRDAFEAEGHVDFYAKSVFNDLTMSLRALDEQRMLYTRRRQRGVLLHPNLARRDGYDVFLIGMELEEIQRFIASGALGTAAATDKGALASLYR